MNVDRSAGNVAHEAPNIFKRVSLPSLCQLEIEVQNCRWVGVVWCVAKISEDLFQGNDLVEIMVGIRNMCQNFLK